MTKMTHEQACEQADKKTEAFEREFNALCKKYEIQWIFAWTHKLVELENSTFVWWFAAVCIDTESLKEVQTIISSYENIDRDVVQSLKKDVMNWYMQKFWLNDEDVEAMKKWIAVLLENINKKIIVEKENATTFIAHFEDFVNIQESVCWFGDIEDLAKVDLYRNIVKQ